MIGVPFFVLGLLLVLSAVVGVRVAGHPHGAVRGFVLSPLHPATWHATAAIVLGFWVELFAFGLAAAAFSTGASMLVVGVGFVIIGLTIEGCRVVARAERWRAGLADARPLVPHAYRAYGSGFRDLVLAVFADVNRWRDVVYVFVAFPLTVLEFVVVVALWGVAIGLLSAPVWIVMSGATAVATAGTDTATVLALVAGLVGLAMLPVAATVSRGLMTLHRSVVVGLLCQSEQRQLERRVETLEGSRRAVLDVEASELRRIERDLHDGAQQRLVSLAIDLSLAAEKIDSDPAGARGLVVGARDQARLALAELRDLVRGIAPAILMDRGLVPALSALAARGGVPTVVRSTLPEGVRLPDSVERAAYFVVAEALTNVAKHASATRCEVRCLAEERGLAVEVWDDGAGGARIVPGGGLAGLAGRVEALDGLLTVDSPDGGPTLVRAAIPVTHVLAPAVEPAASEAATAPGEASAPGKEATGPAVATASGEAASSPGEESAGPAAATASGPAGPPPETEVQEVPVP